MFSKKHLTFQKNTAVFLQKHRSVFIKILLHFFDRN